MNISSFIAARIFKPKEGKNLSTPIISIAKAGIAIGMALMIISVTVVLGFQDEIQKKVVGFGSHIQIISNDDFISKESARVEIAQDFYPGLAALPGVRHIQVFANKPGILETNENIQGVVIKGVGSDFDRSFFEQHLVEGEVIRVVAEEKNPGVMISKTIASRMDLVLGEKVTLYFVQGTEDIKYRNFDITGIYSTGLEEYDSEYVFVDIAYIQKLSAWGLEAQIKVDTSGVPFLVEALAFGGDGKFRYSWSNADWKGAGPHAFCPGADTTLSVVIKDGKQTIADTAWVDFEWDGRPCGLKSYTLRTSGGSYKYYCGGFEVLLDDFKGLLDMDDVIFSHIPYHMQTYTIRQQSPEIFSWLEMLDINVIIIIVLMLLISIINMTSALLIIILERTSMIGILKSFGATNKHIMFIFLRNALRIIVQGLLYGNILGVGLAFLQMKYGWITLDPVNYFLEAVPIHLNLMHVLLLDLTTVFICTLVLIIPAFYVATISPVKAIRLD